MKSSIFLFTSFFFGFTYISHGENYESDYEELIQLFKEWRSFENPPLLERAPDYRKETFDMRQPKFKQLQAQLLAIDTSGWSINEQVDWRLVWAEMNGYDFNYRILKPWERDPAFYKTLWTERSDVPAHEGPTHHGVIDLWKYKFPLDKSSRDQLLVGLRSIPALNDQAKINLTGNAKELWAAGIPSIQVQAEELLNILKLPGVSNDPELVGAIKEASTSTDELVDWLIKIAPTKTGPSGIGKDNYTWYLQKVHLVPLTWGDEVIILKRELARAWSSLKLEEHKNLGLPELKDVSSPEEFDLMAEESIRSLLDFLDQKQIVTVKDYFEAAIREHMGSFIPKDKRNFFSIGMHYDPRPLYSHFYHWFELARMDLEPHKSEVRREALLYNIWDSRNEGTATAVEELFMNAGLYEESPRAREIVYIMIAQRAARGLGSLYAQANEMTMVEAGGIHSDFTPRGWMKTEKELLLFEQHLYMRQPGYGSSYITGKYLLEAALADFAKMKEENGEEFKLKDFFDQLNSIGSIPVSLSHWEMTGIDQQ